MSTYQYSGDAVIIFQKAFSVFNFPKIHYATCDKYKGDNTKKYMGLFIFDYMGD